jgi:hypothetical protein
VGAVGDGRARDTLHTVRRKLIAAFLVACVSACGALEATSGAPADGDAGVSDGGVTDGGATDGGGGDLDGGADGAPDAAYRGPFTCAGVLHTFCDNFDDDGGVIDRNRWPLLLSPTSFSITQNDAPSPPNALRYSETSAGAVTRGYLEAPLPAPAQNPKLTCSVTVQVVTPPGLGASPLHLALVSGDKNVFIVVVLYSDGFDLGARDNYADGGTNYTFSHGVYEIGTPNTPSVLRVDVGPDADGASIVASYGGTAVILHEPLGAPITNPRLRIGLLNGSAWTGSADLRFDDVVCDVQ